MPETTTQRTVFHVVPSSGDWEVKREGGAGVSTHSTKAEAEAAAIEVAKRSIPSQVKIHRKDGVLEEERTYGDDPPRYPG